MAMTDALWLYLRNLFRGFFFTMCYNSTTSCSTPAMFQELGTMSIMLASFKNACFPIFRPTASVHIFKSSEVKSCQAKKSSRVKSNPVKSSQVNSSQVKSAPGPTPIREPNVRAEAEKKNIFIYTPKTVQPQASLRERESSI